MPAENAQRRFAEEVVRALRAAGFVAYWAGGCVRDQLLGREPKDYDVATNAAPDQVRHLFGPRRSLMVGAAFGVVAVRGPRGAGQVEVTTFRHDEDYADGRHPDRVRFSTAEEDAARRDFTINGLFYDPLDDRVIDLVGGQEDLRRRVVRAIGEPEARFTEDKLRMLRAVRFAATLDFTLDEATLAAIRRMAPRIVTVSPERIAMELRRMLTEAGRVRAVELLRQSRLAEAVLPEIAGLSPADEAIFQGNLAVLAALVEPEFPLVLAALLDRLTPAAGAEALGLRWRLANRESERTAWLLEHARALDQAAGRRWSAIQPLLIAPGMGDLVHWLEARARAGQADPADAAFCRTQLARPAAALDPPPLLTGDDLQRHGIPAGPVYKGILERVRQAQLDGEVGSRQEALGLVDQLVEQSTVLSHSSGEHAMDKKQKKKKVQVLRQKIQTLQQQLAGARKQMDDPNEVKALEAQLAAAQAELEKAQRE